MGQPMRWLFYACHICHRSAGTLGPLHPRLSAAEDRGAGGMRTNGPRGGGGGPNAWVRGVGGTPESITREFLTHNPLCTLPTPAACDTLFRTLQRP